MKHKQILPLLLIVICAGCAPNYVNNKPSASTADLVATSYPDTQMKINSACNTIVTSESSLQTKLIRYLESEYEITMDDKNSIVTDATNMIQVTKKQKTYLQSFRPNDTLVTRVNDVISEMDNHESALRALKASVENNDYQGMVDSKNRLSNSNDTLKSLSIV